MLSVNEVPSPTGKLVVFFVFLFLFAALAVTQIVLSLRFPEHAAAVATTLSSFRIGVVFLLGFSIGSMLR